MSYTRYRFHTDPDDYRPVKFPPPGPYWCTGFNDKHSIIVAFLPTDADLLEWWPDATQVEGEPRDAITYTSRFYKPSWWEQTP